MQQVVQAILEDMTAGLLVAAIGTAFVWFSKTRRNISYMIEDWKGEEARPGVEARPGIMVRLQNIEKTQAVTDAKVSNIEHEVNFNSGMSIKDAVHRTDKRTAELDTKVMDHLTESLEWRKSVDEKLN